MPNSAKCLCADPRAVLAASESNSAFDKAAVRPQAKIGRYAISLRDGMAVVLVICLILGGYKMGIRHAQDEAKRHIDTEMSDHLNQRLQELCRDDLDWSKLRTIALNHSTAWESPNSFAHWKSQ